MPTYQEGVGWKCNTCGLVYQREPYAYGCEQSHDTIYIKLHRDDLQRLIQFLYTGDTELISKRLMKTLLKYNTQMKGMSSG